MNNLYTRLIPQRRKPAGEWDQEEVDDVLIFMPIICIGKTIVREFEFYEF